MKAGNIVKGVYTGKFYVVMPEAEVSRLVADGQALPRNATDDIDARYAVIDIADMRIYIVNNDSVELYAES